MTEPTPLSAVTMPPTAAHAGDWRRAVAIGLTWSGAHQLLVSCLGFGAMLVLVRVIPPSEYGRYAAVLGVLTVLNSVNAGVLASHAIQLPRGRDPDWSLYWSAGLYIQLALALVCHALAAVCWAEPAYGSLAPLLVVGSLGFLLDWPAQLRIAMLRRALAFRRLKGLLAVASALGLGTTLGAGLAGAGACALVLGANVVQALPFALDLLLTGWRPRPGWWRWPGWDRCRPALVFGAQQAVSTLLVQSRAAVEGLVLPAAVGYASIGVLNRARALFALAADRPRGIVAEVAYPFLPRSADDPERFAGRALLFAQGMLLVIVPAALYVALEGRLLSRLLYGDRWLAADGLIAPAALAGAAFGLAGVGSSVLLGANRLRRCALVDAAGVLLSIPALGAVLAGQEIAAYAWVLAAGQVAAATVALGAAAPLMPSRWLATVLAPAAVSSAVGAGAVLTARAVSPDQASPLATLLAETAMYGVGLAVALRAVFPRALRTALDQLPGGDRLRSALGL